MSGTATQKDEGADRPGHREAGASDAVSTRKKSKDGKGNEEAKRPAPKRRQKVSAGDDGTQSVFFLGSQSSFQERIEVRVPLVAQWIAARLSPRVI